MNNRNQKKMDTWLACAAIGIVATIIMYIIMMNQEELETMRICMILFFVLMAFSIFSVVMTNVYNAKVKNMNAEEYLNDRFENGWKETKELFGPKTNGNIAANKQITFKYFNLDVNKKKVYRKDGGLYTESPVALTWDDENYYLITYKEKYDSYTHYRVDKMDMIELTEEDRILSDKPFDLSTYSKTMFQMFSGEETDVSIEFDNELVGVVFDRFGTDLPIVKKDEEHFICHVKVAVSPHFLSWIMSFGKKAKIISPDYVAHEMYQLAREITVIYEK